MVAGQPGSQAAGKQHTHSWSGVHNVEASQTTPAAHIRTSTNWSAMRMCSASARMSSGVAMAIRLTAQAEQAAAAASPQLAVQGQQC